ncbi:MAG: hypothetical protein WC495_02710 [Patescibacteria group bacterium]
MNDSYTSSGIRFFFKDFLGDFVAFPLWWYSRGTVRVIQFILEHASRMAQTLSLRIWVKNLFVPMYAQYDIAGRIISFVLRIVVLFYRFVKFVIWLAILLALLGLWLFGPLAVLYYVLYQIFGVTLAL